MKKTSEKLVGLNILGISTIVFSTIMALVLIYSYYTDRQSLDLENGLQVVATFGLLISSIFIFRRIEWARKLIVLSSLYYIIDTFTPLSYFVNAVNKPDIPALTLIFIGLVLFCSIVYYFMRQDVRTRFLKKNI